MQPLDFHPYIRLAMYHTWLSDYYISRSIFDFEIIYIDKGQMKIEFPTETDVVKEGDVVVIPPDVHHRITWYHENCCQPHVHFDFNRDEQSEKIRVSMKEKADMSPEELSQFRPNYFLEHGIHLPYVYHPTRPERIRGLLLDLINAYTFNDPMKELRMEADLKGMIAAIVSDNLGYSDDSEGCDVITLLVHYMSENLQANLTIHDFMLKTNLSAWAINDMFKRAYHTTPKKYYDHLRLTYAKNLLRNSFKSIKEIAEQLGFKEPQTFSRWFHTLDGRYPSEYKMQKKL